MAYQQLQYYRLPTQMINFKDLPMPGNYRSSNLKIASYQIALQCSIAM